MARNYIPVEVDRRVRNAARNRCGYCLSPQHLVIARLEIEHTIPISKGGNNDESNLWLACPICNRYKSDKTTAVDPETGDNAELFSRNRKFWSDHFYWSENGLQIIGLKHLLVGRLLQLYILADDPDVLVVRRLIGY